MSTVKDINYEKKLYFSAEVEEAMMEQLQKYGLAFGDHLQFRQCVEQNVLIHHAGRGIMKFYIMATRRHFLTVDTFNFKIEKV